VASIGAWSVGLYFKDRRHDAAARAIYHTAWLDQVPALVLGDDSGGACLDLQELKHLNPEL